MEFNHFHILYIADDFIISKSDDTPGYTKNPYISDKVASAVIKREQFISEIDNIDKALDEIPCEYRQGVWNNIQFGQAYPLDAGRATYGRYKSKFIYKVAEKFNLI